MSVDQTKKDVLTELEKEFGEEMVKAVYDMAAEGVRVSMELHKTSTSVSIFKNMATETMRQLFARDGCSVEFLPYEAEADPEDDHEFEQNAEQFMWMKISWTRESIKEALS